MENKISKTIQMKANNSLLEYHLYEGIKTEIAHDSARKLIDSLLEDIKKDLESKVNEILCYNSKQSNYNKMFTISVEPCIICEIAHKP